MNNNVLVTTGEHRVKGFRRVDSLSGITSDDIGTLIYHSSKDTAFEIGVELSKLQGKVERVIFINNDVKALLYCFFKGVGADIYDDESYFEDDSIIEFLISDYNNTGMTVKTPDVDLDLLTKSINAITSSDSDEIYRLVTSPFWAKSLSKTVSNVRTAITRTNQINYEVLEMIDNASDILKNLEKSQKGASSELEKLKMLVSDLERKTRINTPFIFSSYKVPSNVTKVMYVKSYSNCRYLNSLLTVYQDYLKIEKNFNSKLLFIMPRLKTNMVKYRDMPRLDTETVDIMDIGASNVYLTYEPKKVVLDAFFNQRGVQIFIVIDLMMGDKLVEGYMVDEFYAVGGCSDIERFKLKPERTFLPISGVKSSLTIPHLSRYNQSNDNTRKTFYINTCREMYERLDSIVLPKRG